MGAASPISAPTRTTCPYCGVGCGIVATPDGKGGAGITGDPEHPANYGRLCSKGSALGETLSLDGRLLHPMLRQPDASLAQTTWEHALDRVAEGFRHAIEQYGPDSVAFYLSGQLLTEDYYVPNKLMKGFIGSANVDTNSRLCMASSVAGHRRAFGADIVPGNYEDIDQADLIVLVGSNAAWCHPVLFQRMQKARAERGAVIVNIDVRRTATSEGADLDLTLKPGTDGILFSGLLVQLAQRGALDPAYIAQNTTGFDEALARAREIAPTMAATAAATGLDAADVAHVFDLWRRTKRVVTLYSQGVNQSAQGTDKVNAIINCHLATGRIGREGMGPFSLTGQPNAMGGREVGGLANQLAAHMGFEPASIERVGRFWGAARMATREGLKAVDLFQAVDEGRIKTLWIMGTNPAVSMPRADAVRAALGKLDLLVVSDNVMSTDTIGAGAHVLLPAAAWGEKDGTVTNSERRISRQRAFLPLPGEAKPDWWAVAQVAARLGFGDAFAYRSAADIFREHAALSAFENDGARDFDLGGLASIDDAQFDALEPVQWPLRAASADGATTNGTARMLADGRFFTPDGKARFIAIDRPEVASQPGPTRPVTLVTGRVRDHWHTMTRTGKAPRLAAHRHEPTLEIGSEDARRHGLVDAGFGQVQSIHGSATLRVAIVEGLGEGRVFAPIHWTDETAVGGRVGALVQALADPVSGQPEMKATPVSVSPVSFEHQGFAIIPAGAGEFAFMRAWEVAAQVAIAGGTVTTFAGDLPAADIVACLAAERHVGMPTISVSDPGRGIERRAWFDGDRLLAVLFVGPGDVVPVWQNAAALFSKGELSPLERVALLSGRAADQSLDQGPNVCACFGVGHRAIAGAIAGGCRSAEAIGIATKAGTNCGSCLPELRALLALSLKNGSELDLKPALAPEAA